MLFYCTEKYCSAQNIYLYTIVSPLGNESTQIHQIINIKRLWKENLSKLGVIYFQNDNRIMSGSMFGAVAIEQSSSRFHNYRWTFISHQNFVEKYFIIWISRHSRIRMIFVIETTARLAKIILVIKNIVKSRLLFSKLAVRLLYVSNEIMASNNESWILEPDFFYQIECSGFERV